MSKKIFSTILNLVIFVSPIAFASDLKMQQSDIQASFNCYKASKPIESLICSDQRLRYVDNKMAIYFKLALTNIPKDQKIAFLNEQKNWLVSRTIQCGTDPVCLYKYYKKHNFELFQKIYVNNKASDSDINISSPLSFADFTVIGKVNKTLLARLNLIKIDGDGQFQNGFRERDDSHLVKNCDDYWKYGIDASSTYGMSMESFFIHTCKPLKKLLSMKTPNISYLHNISISDEQWMGLSFLPLLSDDQQKEIENDEKKGITVSDLIKNGKVRLKKNSTHSFNLIYGDMTESIDEIARGDFTGDGIESILVNIATYSTTGSYRAYSINLITRSGNNERLKLINLPNH